MTRVAIARECGATVISDEGRGLPAARMLGARSATGEVVALIDADVVLPPESLRGLLAEFESGGYDGLQFGLASEADGPGYWGAALAWHHNHSRVRSWFGVSATLMRRDVLLAVGFDDDFRSGEDVELRIRLEQAGYRLGRLRLRGGQAPVRATRSTMPATSGSRMGPDRPGPSASIRAAPAGWPRCPCWPPCGGWACPCSGRPASCRIGWGFSSTTTGPCSANSCARPTSPSRSEGTQPG